MATVGGTYVDVFQQTVHMLMCRMTLNYGHFTALYDNSTCPACSAYRTISKSTLHKNKQEFK